MRVEPPPNPPKGSKSLIEAYNDLRDYIMGRQWADVQGSVKAVSITSTKSGRLVSFEAVAAGTPGACCISGACSITDVVSCLSAGGNWIGAGTQCLSDTCAAFGSFGACCYGTSCAQTTQAACAANGGVFVGGACNPCHVPPGGGNGACCTQGACTIGPQWSCNGQWMGQGTDCHHTTCFTEPTGACCQTPTAQCVVTTFPECGGIYFGDNIPCNVVGSCESAYCTPGNYFCACRCVNNPNLCGSFPGDCCQPAATCCQNTLPQCETCYDPIGQLYYCCCCSGCPGPYCGCCCPVSFHDVAVGNEWYRYFRYPKLPTDPDLHPAVYVSLQDGYYENR